MKTAISYARYSHKLQAKGDSLRRQTEFTRRYCERHGLTLDESYSFRDLGVSSFRGKNFDTGALGTFLAAVRSGRIPKGVTLVVESLDRISRKTARKALNIIEEIIEEGVTIATTNPERFYSEKNLDDPMALIELILIFVRANEESQRKSERAKENWNQKQRNASKTVITTKLPAWLKTEGKGDKMWIVPDKAKAKAVRTIIELSANGYGAPKILDHLHKNKIANPTTGKPVWSLATVQLYMRDRRMIGEYQPHEYKHIDGKQKRVPILSPVSDYYPAIVDMQTFNRAQVAISNRRQCNVKATGNVVNLFTGLLKDPETNSTWAISRKGTNKESRLMPYAVRNKQAKGLSVDYNEVENAILDCLFASDLKGMLPQPNNDAAEMQAKLDDVEDRIAKLKSRLKKELMSGSDDFDIVIDTLKDTLTELQTERDELAETIRNTTQSGTAAAHSHEAAKQLIEEMRKATGEKRNEMRLALKAHLQNILKPSIMRTTTHWRWSIGVITLHFADYGTRRVVTHKGVLPEEQFDWLAGAYCFDDHLAKTA